MRKYSSNLAFVDLLFNLLVGFTSLFIIAFLMINPIAKQGEVDPPVMMMVQMRWEDESIYDVDLWVKSPESLIGYSIRESGYATLERDDLGRNNDKYIVNGEERIILRNYEVVNFTALPDGEYTINAHMFSNGFKGEMKVSITVTLIGPYREVWSGDIILTKSREERTAITFVVENGEVLDLNDNIQKPVRKSIEGNRP